MLKDLHFEYSYDTNFDDDVIEKFYEPALSASKTYRRMAGFFRSSSLAATAEGISNFVKNNGRMEVVACPYFTDEDIKIINQIEFDSEIDSFLEDVLSRELTPQMIENENVEAMGWMLANNFLEIRVVLVKRETGEFVFDNIFHNKVGILSDGENQVVFSGSINESLSGWKENIETFDVFCDWRDPPERIDEKISNFEKYWRLGESKRKVTVKLPDAVKKKWIKTIPSDRDSLSIFKNEMQKNSVQLREYQNIAIDNWFNNHCCGIFNMATGTGKTLTAIHAVKRLLEETKGKFILVVAVPLQHLIEDPWIKTLTSEISKERKLSIVRAFNNSKIWLKDAKIALRNYKFDISDNITLITTYDTLSSENFISFIKPIKGKKILVADEVHNCGSSKNREGLLDEYECRLGLSATPARYLDDEGTGHIQTYFDKEVYSFPLQRAITEINPNTGKTYLTPYNYYPIFVNINDKELKKYVEFSGKIAKYVGRDDLTPAQKSYMENLLINRSRIIKNAASKLSTLSKLLPKYKDEGILNHCLIYCSDGKDSEDENTRSREKVITELNKIWVSSRRFTAEEKIDERQEILHEFATGEVSVIVAIKCLDEGVDVPSTRNAIIMASTGNPREYIQRRGRVLRRDDDKECANIYDFVVIPREKSFDLDSEIQIFMSEYKRFKEFSNYSLNKEENENMIKKIVEMHSICLEEDE